MSSWFSFWRVQTKLEECTGPFSVGCSDFMCAKDESTGFSTEGGSFIRFFYTQRRRRLEHWMNRKDVFGFLVKNTHQGL